MAKDLPYFKFFCSEWSDGDITLEELKVQGLFINLCAYYWSNECNITLTKARKKFRFCKDNSFDLLIESEIIKVEKDVIIINFLDEQKKENHLKSLIKQKGGRASAKARRLKKDAENQSKNEQKNNNNLTDVQQVVNTSSTENEHVLNCVATETQLLREEKIRKDKSNTLTLNTSERDSLKNIDVEVEDDKLHDFKYKDYNEFLKDWNNARKHFEKKESNISKLSIDELNDFKRLKQDFTIDDFKNGIRGLFMQKQMFATNRLRPRHFLQEMNIEKYIDCHHNKIQLFEDKSKNQRL
jgi:hypothetical protein